MGLSLSLVDDLTQADLLLTSKGYYRKKPQTIAAAEAAGIPVYALKGNAAAQIEQGLAGIFSEGRAYSITIALKEAEMAIEKVKSEGREVELSPQNSFIRRLQHQLVEKADLQSQSTGKEPQRRVRIFTD
jgi:S-adenosylhomocysteine hydrolase